MRLYTLLKLIGQAIKTILSDISTLKTSKQNKAWKSLGSTTGTLKLSLAGYTELNVFVYFGGVRVSQVIPTSRLSTTAMTLYVGYYSNPIYVNVTTTSAVITKQPSGYTGTLEVFAR